MPAPLRLLFLSEPAAASRAVGLIEQQSPVEASLATHAGVLRTALRDERWDGLLVIPGGPVLDVEIARIYAEATETPPLLVVGAKVPEALRAVGATAVAQGALDALAALLRSVLASRIPTLHVPPEPAAAPEPSPPRPTSSTKATQPSSGGSLDDVSDRVFEMPMSTVSSSDELASDQSAIEAIADHLTIGVYRSTPEGRILYANPAMARILGVEDPEQLGSLDVQWDLEYPRETFEARIRETGEVRNLIVSWAHPSGRTVHTRENARIVRNARGRILYYEGTIEDVTEEIEGAARERLRTRQSAAAIAFYVAADEAVTTAGLHRDALQAFQEAFEADWALIVRPFNGRNRVVAQQGLTGALISEVEAHTLFSTAPIPSRTTLLRDIASSHGLPDDLHEMLEAAGLVSFGCFPLLNDGQPLGSVLIGYRTPHTFSDEEVQGGEMLAWHLAGYLARRMTEQSLEDTEATLHFVTEHTRHALYRRRASGEFDYLSPVVETLTGYSAAELIAMGGWDALVVQPLMEATDLTFDGQESVLLPIRTRAGEVRWIENTVSAWCDASGYRIGEVGVLHDATDRKRRDDAQIHESQRALARQRALVELATIATGTEIAELVMQRAVEMACRVAETDQASIWLREGDQITCQALFPESGEPGRYRIEAFEAVVEGMPGQRALAIDKVASDERAVRLGLDLFASSLGASGLLIAPIRQSGAVVGGVLLHRKDPSPDAWSEADIAFAAAVADALALTLEREELAEAQRALEASEVRYRMLAELTSDYAFAVVADDEGHGPIAWATDAFYRISGYTPEEIGTTRGLQDILHPDSLQAVCQAYTQLQATGTVDFEARIMTRDEETRWVHHRARVSADGQDMVYHSGEDITERKRFEAELVDARERAEAMGRLKSAFLANMSHEIRTPLTSILGYSDLLLDELEADQRDFVLHIAQSGVRLLDTLNSVLDLARLEADGVELQVRPITVADHVESAIEPYRQEAARRGLGFHVDTDPTIQAELDPACFQRIVTNLVGNAVKFTEAGGVAVQVEADEALVHLHVRDTGVGMDEAFLENLFTDFQQESFGHNRSYEGTGLGMSITKRYVDLLGGTIDVETQKGVGSSFVVSFPLLWSRSEPSEAYTSVHDQTRVPKLRTETVPDAPVRPFQKRIGVVSEPADSVVARARMAPNRVQSHSGSSVTVGRAPDLPLGDTSGLGFEIPLVSADTPRAIADFVSPSPGPFQRTDPPVSHDPSLPTDMFFNRPEKTPDASAVPSESAPPAPEAAAPAPQPEEPQMIVRGPASEPPQGPPPAWPPAPSAPAAAAVPVPEPTAHTATPTPPATPPAQPAASPAPPAQAATPTESDDARPALLVVEDNDDTRMLLDRILRSAYTVTAVGDARSALIEMNRNQFVGLVLDINLGGKETGADILRIARTLDGYRDVFAIALTAYALPGDRERLLEAGFNEYISKPFTRHSLMEALKVGLAH